MSTWRMAGLKYAKITIFLCVVFLYSESLSYFQLPLWHNDDLLKLAVPSNCSYVNYSNIAAKILRRSLKSEHKEEALKRGEPSIQYFYWANGESLPAGEKPAKAEKEKA